MYIRSKFKFKHRLSKLVYIARKVKVAGMELYAVMWIEDGEPDCTYYEIPFVKDAVEKKHWEVVD